MTIAAQQTRPCPACGATLTPDDTHWSLFPEPMGGYVCPIPANDALAEAGAIAASFLELGPEDLAVVERCVSPAVIGLALVTVQSDVEFAPRWKATGTDWMAQAHVLQDAIVWILTPEAAAG